METNLEKIVEVLARADRTGRIVVTPIGPDLETVEALCHEVYPKEVAISMRRSTERIGPMLRLGLPLPPKIYDAGEATGETTIGKYLEVWRRFPFEEGQ